MHRCGVKGVVGAQDIHPSNTCLPLTAGVASGRTVGVAWVVGRRDLSNIRKKNSWKLGFGRGKVAVQRLAGVVGFRCLLPYLRSHVYDTTNAVTGRSPSSRTTSKQHSSSHFSHWLWYYHHEPSKFSWTLPSPRHGQAHSACSHL